MYHVASKCWVAPTRQYGVTAQLAVWITEFLMAESKKVNTGLIYSKRYIGSTEEWSCYKRIWTFPYLFPFGLLCTWRGDSRETCFTWLLKWENDRMHCREQQSVTSTHPKEGERLCCQFAAPPPLPPPQIMEHVVILVCAKMQLQMVLMLQVCLWHDFYNIVFTLKHNLYIASGSAPSTKIFWVHTRSVIWLKNLWKIRQNYIVAILCDAEGTVWMARWWCVSWGGGIDHKIYAAVLPYQGVPELAFVKLYEKWSTFL